MHRGEGSFGAHVVDGNKWTIFSACIGVTSSAHPKLANGYTFLHGNTTVYGAGFADSSAWPILGGSSIQPFTVPVIGQAISLHNGTGFPRNSSALLWCFPDATCRTIVAYGTVAIEVDLTVRLTIGYAASYKLFGGIFIATEARANSGTCYGSDPYYYYTHPLPKYPGHAGVLCIGEKAALVHTW